MSGLMQFTPNDAMPESPAHELQEAQEQEQQGNISVLAGYLHGLWGAARDAKRDVETAMLKMARQKRGEYDPDLLEKIRKTNGSDVFIPLTRRKCRDARAWIMDIIKPLGREKSWCVEPTPLPDMVPELMAQAEAEAGQGGDAKALYEKKIKRIREEAKKRGLRMERVIEDQLTECDFEATFHDFLGDVIDLKAGILKGPVLREKIVQRGWQQTPDGWEAVIKREVVPDVDRVDPFRFFPAPYSRHAQDSYTVEWHDLSVKQLIAYRGVPGYSEDAINAAIAQFGNGNGRWIDSEILLTLRDARQGSQTQNTSYDDRLDVLEFWCSVMGSKLAEWQFVGLEDDESYDINAWVIGPHVIRCIINPNPMQKNPYHVTSFIKCNGSIWGEGLPDTIVDDQRMVNMLGRAVANNAAFCSLPQISVNELRLASSDDRSIYPGKLWRHEGGAMAGERPVDFHQPPVVVPALLGAMNDFLQQSDADSGIPAYAHGDARVGGAGNTKGGLSMLLSMASKGIFGVVTNISDGVLHPLIDGFFTHNMLYNPDPDIKGDAQITPAGVAAMMQREQSVVRINEFAQLTANPIDMPIIGAKGRAELLRALSSQLDLPTDKIIPSEEEMVAKEEAAQQQPQAQLSPLDMAKAADIQASAALKMAQATNIRVESLYSAMQTAATASQTPGIAPVADSIAKSAGFQDQDAPPIYPDVQPGQPVPDMPQNTHPLSPANPDMGMMQGMETADITDAGRQ